MSWTPPGGRSSAHLDFDLEEARFERRSFKERCCHQHTSHSSQSEAGFVMYWGWKPLFFFLFCFISPSFSFLTCVAFKVTPRHFTALICCDQPAALIKTVGPQHAAARWWARCGGKNSSHKDLKPQVSFSFFFLRLWALLSLLALQRQQWRRRASHWHAGVLS